MVILYLKNEVFFPKKRLIEWKNMRNSDAKNGEHFIWRILYENRKGISFVLCSLFFAKLLWASLQQICFIV